MEAVGVGIKQSSDALAIGTTPGMAWESGQPSPFFSFLKPFRDFGFISAIENQMQHPERLFNKIQGQVKSALVAQIYADQQCSVRCVGDRDKKHPARCGDPGTWCPADSPGTLCMASCYNGVKEDNKKLFNYDKATSDPWNLDLDSAIPAAWKMWQSGKSTLPAISKPKLPIYARLPETRLSRSLSTRAHCHQRLRCGKHQTGTHIARMLQRVFTPGRVPQGR